jgi:hypothetical protein
MYTKGILKIFTVRTPVKLVFIKSMAEAAGYDALAFSGDIYVKPDDEDWTLTCFSIEDFEG